MINIIKIEPVKRVSIFQEKGEKFTLFLKKGEIVNGKILQKLDDMNYLIRMKGHNIVAESEYPLVKGEEKTFKVIKTYPKIELKLMESRPVNLEGEENKIQILKSLNLPVNKSNIAILNLIESLNLHFNP
ncbi:hypothetical protein DRQ09_01635, partial [candidate division KSB1 bacterium]